MIPRPSSIFDLPEPRPTRREKIREWVRDIAIGVGIGMAGWIVLLLFGWGR